MRGADLKSVIVVGTAGSGKSLLASKIREHYASTGAYVANLNLDPGVEELPYESDIDVRDHIDIVSIMKQYGLGPNGALIMANDLIAAKLDELWRQVDTVNPDYLVIDTPGQIELFAHRASGPFIAESAVADEKACIFLFDGMLVQSPTNFVSIALIAESIRLKLGMPTLYALTKSDLIADSVENIVKWSSDDAALAAALSHESNGESFELSTAILRSLKAANLLPAITPISNVTGAGLVNLWAELSRTIDQGEEIVD